MSGLKRFLFLAWMILLPLAGWTGEAGTPGARITGRILPGRHRMNNPTDWPRLAIQGVHNFECDIHYAGGRFLLGHDKKDLTPGHSLERAVEVIEQTAPLFTGETTFIYLDGKELPNPEQAAWHIVELLQGLRRRHPEVRIQWIFTGGAPEALGQRITIGEARDCALGSDILGNRGLAEKESDVAAGRLDPPRNFLDMDITDSRPSPLAPHLRIMERYFSAEHAAVLAPWWTRPVTGGGRDPWPVRLYTPVQRETIEDVVKQVSQGRKNGRVAPQRDVYLCADLDVAEQALWLGRRASQTGVNAFDLGAGEAAPTRTATTLGADGRQWIVQASARDGGLELRLRVRAAGGAGKVTAWSAQVLAGIRVKPGTAPDVALVWAEEKLWALAGWIDPAGKARGQWLALDPQSGTAKATGTEFGLGTAEADAIALDLTRVKGKCIAAVLLERAGQLRLGAFTAQDFAGRWTEGRWIDLGAGHEADVALSGDPSGSASLLVVYRAPEGDTLWTRRIELDGTGKYNWQSEPRRYDKGICPSVAAACVATSHGTALVYAECHQSQSSARLWYTAGRLASRQVIGEKPNRSTNGEAPDADLIPQALHAAYEDGEAPSVALASGLKGGAPVMAETHTQDGKERLCGWALGEWLARMAEAE